MQISENASDGRFVGFARINAVDSLARQLVQNIGLPFPGHRAVAHECRQDLLVTEVLAPGLELLGRLAKFDARAVRVTEMRVFLGLSEEEIAEALQISTRTVKRDWALAKAWLKAEMAHTETPSETSRKQDSSKAPRRRS